MKSHLSIGTNAERRFQTTSRPSKEEQHSSDFADDVLWPMREKTIPSWGMWSAPTVERPFAAQIRLLNLCRSFAVTQPWSGTIRVLDA
jgi:hypothetical protein